MPTYRAYRVDDRRRILTGAWLQADDDAEAIEQAGELCDERTEVVELWEGPRLVKDLDCEPGNDDG
jgi:hypothetical protein